MNYEQFKIEKEIIESLLKKATKVESINNYNPDFAQKDYLQKSYAFSSTNNKMCIIWNKVMYIMEKTAETLQALVKLKWRYVPFCVPQI